MRKPWNSLLNEEKEAFVRERRERRAYRTKDQIKALTVDSIARAWNIPVTKVIEKVLQLPKKDAKVETNE